MVEEIITALSRIRWLFVIARNSSFAYKGHDIDVKQIGRELGVRYVLEGSVRKAAARVRIAAQLVDAIAGAHLWADHFDGAFDDIFELQDQVAASVAAVIEPTLEAVEIRRSNARPTRDLTAYDLYLRALPDCFSFEQHAAIRALALFEQAIARDPHFGPALALAAYLQMQLIGNGWVEDAKAWRDKAIERAHQALRAAGDDPEVLAEAAYALAALGEDIATMLTLADRALALNPNFARGWFISGVIGLWAGDADRAIEHVETALRLSPRDRLGGHFHVLGAAHFFKRRFAEAEAKLLLWMQDHPSHPNSHRFLAACYAHMGRLDEARAVVDRLRRITGELPPPHRGSAMPRSANCYSRACAWPCGGQYSRNRPLARRRTRQTFPRKRPHPTHPGRPGWPVMSNSREGLRLLGAGPAIDAAAAGSGRSQFRASSLVPLPPACPPLSFSAWAFWPPGPTASALCWPSLSPVIVGGAEYAAAARRCNGAITAAASRFLI